MVCVGWFLHCFSFHFSVLAMISIQKRQFAFWFMKYCTAMIYTPTSMYNMATCDFFILRELLLLQLRTELF